MAKGTANTTLLPQRADFKTYQEYRRACLAAKAAMFGNASMRFNSKIKTGLAERAKTRSAKHEEQ